MSIISIEEFTKTKKECSLNVRMSLIAMVGSIIFFGMTIVNLFEENIIKLGIYEMKNELQLSLVIFGVLLIGSIFIFFYSMYKRYKIRKIRPSLLRITDYSKKTIK